MLFFPRDYGEFLLQRVVFLVVLWYNLEENNRFLGRMERCMVEKTYSMGLYGICLLYTSPCGTRPTKPSSAKSGDLLNGGFPVFLGSEPLFALDGFVGRVPQGAAHTHRRCV